MARKVICDVCKKPTDEIVGKLFYTPLKSGKVKDSQYTHHADVGECCAPKLMQVISFRERMTQEQYQKSRRKQRG